MIKRVFSSKILLFILPLFFGFSSFGQTVLQDSVAVAKANVEEKVEHSPKKATIYSAVLPGLGQAYNKKYWKIPLIYAGFGTIGYFIHWNNDNYKILRQAYSDLTDGDETTRSYENLEGAEYYDLDNQTDYNNFKTGLSKQQSYYRRNRDLLIISMVGFYGLNIIDASVDAHLFDFDISEDLTFNWEPTMQYRNFQYVYGVSCTFTF
ncbi:DUF5683 domain-containing protein [Draconibacterium sp. IB214405]|uniref:DUF5683 domain-containing protein n=1 Tax=Draconibacterium sp. IB214405 TaxID=3097352 RepID=UPI002A0B8504|nr:DUF5683 domain-containing protein [Draconibacterium sp. IB214405]MDX8338320.1 DUF5683 domain-containing protein [Draconibacterium sp. IB214405]